MEAKEFGGNWAQGGFGGSRQRVQLPLQGRPMSPRRRAPANSSQSPCRN